MQGLPTNLPIERSCSWIDIGIWKKLINNTRILGLNYWQPISIGLQLTSRKE